MTINKYVRDGKVAVLISPGFGAGWSTWGPSESSTEQLFDTVLVELVLNGPENHKAWEKYAEDRWPDAYLGGLYQLEVHWVEEGQPFDVDEHDGSESLVVGERRYKA